MVVGCIFGGLLGYSILPTIVLRMKAWNGKGEKDRSNPLDKSRKKEVYLTFDDGPDVRYTNELLDVLKQHRVVATFFVVVQFAKEHPKY